MPWMGAAKKRGTREVPDSCRMVMVFSGTRGSVNQGCGMVASGTTEPDGALADFTAEDFNQS